MRNVLVIGSGRSGTSLAAGTLAGPGGPGGAGYHMGEALVEPREANPKGFFESRSINAINEMILSDAVPFRDDDDTTMPHVPQRRQYWLANLPPGAPLRSTPDVTMQIAAAVRREPWCYKDPRFCYTLPVWRPYIGDAALVCVFRHPAATVASMLKEVATARYLSTLKLEGEGAFAVWTAMYRRVLDAHRHTGDWMFVHVEQLMDDAGLDRLEAFVGSRVDRTFGEKRLQRSASDGEVPAGASAAYAELCELAGYAG